MTTPVTPAAQPAPKNGAATAAPQQPVTPPAQSQPQTPDELATVKQRAQQLETEMGKKTREQIAERRKWDTEKKTMGGRLKLADEHERLMREKDINPISAAKALWGDGWWDKLQQVQANGGAPTAESVQLGLERMREETRLEFDEREEKAKAARAEQAQQAEQSVRTGVRADASVAYEQLAEQYPLFVELGDKDRVAQIVANQIQGPDFARYRAALEMGDVDTCATLMRKAFDKLEGSMLSIADRAAGSEKYQGKLREKLTPPKTQGTVSPVVKSTAVSSAAAPSQQPRRSLSNDLTGSTPGDAPKHRTDEERRADAIARYHELASKQ